MSELIDHLADLTGFRDRDVLDVTLVGAFKDLLQPISVAIYRSIGEGGEERWLTRARIGEHDKVATADPTWAELTSLPRLDEFPLRRLALLTQGVQQAEPPSNITVFPLVTDRDVVGVLEIETASLMDAAAKRTVASILRIYRNFQGLLDYSERDTLTGLLNRKTFDESFLKASGELGYGALAAVDDGRRASGSGVSSWLGVIDIDHFKRVNDNYGHLIGDEVLLLLSRLMRNSFRFGDRLYRFGGEEFVVLMRCANEQAAAHALERLRAETAAYAFPQVGQITISIGFTVVKTGDTPSGAFERADKAVYYAKEHGRNQVRSHAELLSAGELEDSSKSSDFELF